MVHEICRDEAGDDAENRSEQGKELQNRQVEDDGAPAHEDGEDEDAIAYEDLINFFLRHDAAQDVHSQALAGFAEAEEDTEESCDDGEDIEDDTEDLDAGTVETAGSNGQSRDVIRIGFDSLLMTHSQIEGHGIGEDGQEKDTEGDAHGPHGFVACHINRFFMRPIGNDHRANAGNEKDGHERDRQHGHRFLDQISRGRQRAQIADIPILYHEKAEENDDRKLRQDHQARDPEEKLFATRTDEDHEADDDQSIPRAIRKHCFRDAEGMQVRGAVIGKGRRIHEDAGQDAEEIEDAQKESPVLPQIARYRRRVIFTFLRGRQGIDEQALQ